MGKENYSSRDWERQRVPDSHSHANKREPGTAAVGLDAVSRCA